MYLTLAKRLAPWVLIVVLAAAFMVSASGRGLLTQGTVTSAVMAQAQPASTSCGVAAAPATASGIEAAIREVWPQDQWVTAWAVQRHESGGKADAYNPALGGHHGHFQISEQHDEIIARHGDWYDPLSNARMAKELWDDAKARGRDPWQPWESYTTGRHEQYLDEARAVMGSNLAPAGPSTNPAPVPCAAAVAVGAAERPDGSNGRIDPAQLCQVGVAPAGTTEGLLTCKAAAAFDLMAQKYAADMGKPICFGNGYRTLATQVFLEDTIPHLAAVAGTSNHGWGLAVDLCDGVEIFGAPEHQWMVANAGAFGWVHPPWAQRGGSRPEAWHWEFGVQ